MIVPLSILKKKKNTHIMAHISTELVLLKIATKNSMNIDLKICQWSNFEIWQRDFSA